MTENIENTVEVKKPTIPFEVVVKDTENAIITIINQSNLPTFIISNILSSLSMKYAMVSNDIVNQKRNEYNKQLTEYENAHKQED